MYIIVSDKGVKKERVTQVIRFAVFCTLFLFHKKEDTGKYFCETKRFYPI